jgi:nitrogen fixation protein NifU and related proteins
MIYKEHIMDHYRHPRNKGSLESPDYTLTDNNETCGDTITVYFQVKNEKIVQAKQFSQGCAISQAAASMLFEQVEGLTVQELLKLPNQTILEEFGTELTVSRVKCALLPLFAAKKAFTHAPSEQITRPTGAIDDARD